jgi:hypothetical protein
MALMTISRERGDVGAALRHLETLTALAPDGRAIQALRADAAGRVPALSVRATGGLSAVPRSAFSLDTRLQGLEDVAGGERLCGWSFALESLYGDRDHRMGPAPTARR